MGTRLSLHELLCGLLGSRFVYFQPPASKQLDYPAIIYRRSDERVLYADGSQYLRKKKYTLTIIDSDPDSLIPDKVSKLQMSKFERAFTSDNLNHDVYNIFY